MAPNAYFKKARLLTKNVQKLVEAQLDAVAQEVVEDFERSMSTWENHKPKIRIVKSPYRRVVIAEGDIYYYTNFGTKVRYAVMSVPFYPKTIPGVLNAGSGVGQMAYISKFPRAGIKARRFDLIIAELAQASLTKRFTTSTFRLVEAINE